MVNEKKILGISYWLLKDLLSQLDETCSALEKQGKGGKQVWKRARGYKYVVQRILEQSCEVYQGKELNLASLELRYLFVPKEGLPKIAKRLYDALEKAKGEKPLNDA